MLSNKQPYIVKETIIKEYSYNPEYGDDKICQCFHPYHRHFDSHNCMANVGCKYCPCEEFKPINVYHTNMREMPIEHLVLIKHTDGTVILIKPDYMYMPANSADGWLLLDELLDVKAKSVGVT